MIGIELHSFTKASAPLETSSPSTQAQRESVKRFQKEDAVAQTSAKWTSAHTLIEDYSTHDYGRVVSLRESCSSISTQEVITKMNGIFEQESGEIRSRLDIPRAKRKINLENTKAIWLDRIDRVFKEAPDTLARVRKNCEHIFNVAIVKSS